jgi:hypothetical protein
MEDQMMLYKSNLPGHWAPPLPTQGMITGSNALITKELGTRRMLRKKQ